MTVGALMPAILEPDASLRFLRWITGLCLALGLLALQPTTNAHAGDALYGALVMATQEDQPKAPPSELRDQAESLQSVFGYNEFRILGQKRQEVPKGTEDWLVSSPKFFLRVDTKSPLPGGYSLGLELLQEKRVVAKANVKLQRGVPLYIKGPLVGDGQLIILLMVL